MFYFLLALVFAVTVYDVGPPPAVGVGDTAQAAKSHIDFLKTCYDLNWSKAESAEGISWQIKGAYTVCQSIRDGKTWLTCLFGHLIDVSIIKASVDILNRAYYSCFNKDDKLLSSPAGQPYKTADFSADRNLPPTAKTEEVFRRMLSSKGDIKTNLRTLTQLETDNKASIALTEQLKADNKANRTQLSEFREEFMASLDNLEERVAAFGASLLRVDNTDKRQPRGMHHLDALHTLLLAEAPGRRQPGSQNTGTMPYDQPSTDMSAQVREICDAEQASLRAMSGSKVNCSQQYY